MFLVANHTYEAEFACGPLMLVAHGDLRPVQMTDVYILLVRLRSGEVMESHPLVALSEGSSAPFYLQRLASMLW